MKTYLTLILLLFSYSLSAQIDSLMADSLQRMADKDKSARQKVGTAFKKYGKDSPQWKKAWGNMQDADKKHNAALKNILARYNTYPSADKVGEEGSHNFWMLVLHQDADTALQEQVVAWMKIPVDQGTASPNDYAYLVDRILVNAGKKQMYGTQCYYDNEKKMYLPHPLLEPADTDERRKEMQLPPL
ncbi:MAG TPA: DUF6624 domain-containing protein, partial [Bacteroidia bacterium]|nr:DUF6624 domain-containing protein [Bacteroidia bacterium]